jgi:hypothetical protein
VILTARHLPSKQVASEKLNKRNELNANNQQNLNSGKRFSGGVFG